MSRSCFVVRVALGCTLLAPTFLSFIQANAAPVPTPVAPSASADITSTPAPTLHVGISTVGNTVTFKPGEGVSAVRVQITSSTGNQLYNSGWMTGFDAGLDALTWQALDDKGAPLPPGLYLTLVEVRGTDGTTKTESGSLQLEAASVAPRSDVSPRATITGAGTANRIVLWTSASTIGDSIITQTSSNALSVAGSLTVTNTITTKTVSATNPNGNALVGNSTGGTALAGVTKSGNGVLGISDSAFGVRGVTGRGTGVRGDSNQGTTGVQGNSNAAPYNNSVPVGVDGVANGGATSIGVRGTSTKGIGVQGSTDSTTGGSGGTTLTGATGVLGIATATSGGGYSAGVKGINNSTSGLGIGVYGAHAGSGYGVYGFAPSGYGVFAQSTSGYGLYASSSSSYGIYGSSNSGYGLYGRSSSSTGVYGSGDIGVYGASIGSGDGVRATSNGIGVRATSSSSSGAGVYAKGYIGVQGNTDGTANSQAIRGENNNSTTGYAGVFSGQVFITGDVTIQGNVSKGGGSFRIDDPTDPANKYLSHSFVESPDMMNIYNGNVTTDNKGYATVTLPKYFGSLNRDFRYQLTSIGSFARAIIAQEIKDNRFVIRTDTPNVKVSWQVTGVRRDPWANDHRIPVQQLKVGAERGLYLYPAGYHKPQSLSMAHLVDLPKPTKNGAKTGAAKVAAPRLHPAPQEIKTVAATRPNVPKAAMQSTASLQGKPAPRVAPRVAQAAR